MHKVLIALNKGNRIVMETKNAIIKIFFILFTYYVFTQFLAFYLHFIIYSLLEIAEKHIPRQER